MPDFTPLIMQNLKHGDSGQAVQNVQVALNFVGPTRLPRLTTDGNFDALTMARVMEFQFQNGLSVDGVVGPATNDKLPADAPGSGDVPAPPQGRSIQVNLFDRELTAYEDGTVAMHISPVAGGRPGFRSTFGVFQMTSRRLRHHSSSKFPGKDNMAFSLFYNGGEAIHQGDPNTPSHGCIHVGKPFAEQLFNWAGATNIWVIVER
jgi:Putative peptidoglycan binding domain/L,D-transpeptidase catalytic domain